MLYMLFFLNLGLATSTTPFPEHVWGGLIGDGLIPFDEARSVRSLLESGSFLEALSLSSSDLIQNQIIPHPEDLRDLIREHKQYVDTLRHECFLQSRRLSNPGKSSTVERACTVAERTSNQRMIHVLGRDLISFLLNVLIVPNSGYEETQRADFLLALGDFSRYVFEAGYQDQQYYVNAHWAYDKVISMNPVSYKNLLACNNKGLLFKVIEGPRSGIEYLRSILPHADAAIRTYVSQPDFDVNEAFAMNDIVRMMHHNISVWTDEEWIFV